MKNIAIIGAGACGLLLAGLLKNEYKVTLLEKNNKLGKKILASGNGKCNFTNIGDYKGKYNNEFAEYVVNKFDNKVLRDYLSSLGLTYRVDEENRAYPLSESSATILDILKKQLGGVRILLESKVNRIMDKGKYINVYYNDIVEQFDYVVCCSGSSASNLGSDLAYTYLRDYGVCISKLSPSLVPIKVSEDIHELNGVRAKCLVSLYKNDNFLYKEKGEVLFKDISLSGIVMYNMSSMINRDIHANYKISLDLFDDAYNKENFNDLSGSVHPKIKDYLLKNNIVDISKIVFNFNGFEKEINAQVICGGINLSEINNDLSLKRNSNIFVGGEVIDCDGMCGGYNLQFAFACAFLINESIRNKEKD